jgi:two-component system phosphate regulon sensor histidine kinase PhoR
MRQFLLGFVIACVGLIWLRHDQNQQILSLLRLFKHPDSRKDSKTPLWIQLRYAIKLSLAHQEKLANLLEISQALLQNAPIGYLQVDEEDRLIYCNHQAEQILSLQGWPSQKHRLFLEVIHSYELDQLLGQTRDQQTPAVKEWLYHPVCVDGNQLKQQQGTFLKASSLPLPERQVGVYLENQQQLIELSQNHHQWFIDLAHELRTPLTAINLVAEYLAKRIAEEDRPWLQQLQNQTHRLIELVQNWLELSRTHQHPLKTLQPQSVELCSLIQEVWQGLALLGEEKQITLDIKTPDQVWLSADRTRLGQVFTNVLHNAIKHSPAQAVVYLEIHQTSSGDSPYVEVNVIDTGSGFSSADLPYIFERYYRGNSDHSYHEFGHGLGLAIVEEIILAHGGSITARNHPETAGAWLQITLPTDSQI